MWTTCQLMGGVDMEVRGTSRDAPEQARANAAADEASLRRERRGKQRPEDAAAHNCTAWCQFLTKIDTYFLEQVSSGEPLRDPCVLSSTPSHPPSASILGAVEGHVWGQMDSLVVRV